MQCFQTIPNIALILYTVDSIAEQYFCFKNKSLTFFFFLMRLIKVESGIYLFFLQGTAAA